jgi:hypothetical protein
MNLIKHVQKNVDFKWQVIELAITEREGLENPYYITATGADTVFNGAYPTIDLALEEMQKLRDELK